MLQTFIMIRLTFDMDSELETSFVCLFGDFLAIILEDCSVDDQGGSSKRFDVLAYELRGQS